MDSSAHSSALREEKTVDDFKKGEENLMPGRYSAEGHDCHAEAAALSAHSPDEEG